jgi:hypothetical protein
MLLIDPVCITWGVWGATTGQPSRRRRKARPRQCRGGPGKEGYVGCYLMR